MSDTRFGLVIGTFAAVPYLHLQLETARRLYPEVPVLIHDDGSQQGTALAALAAEYGADFVSTSERQPFHLGDLCVYPAGLHWAGERGVELLLKLSRRWIWRADWRPSLGALADESDADTFSNHTISYAFGFRSECVAFRVERWAASDFAAAVALCLADRRHVFVENYLHRWAMYFSRTGSESWHRWQQDHPGPPERSGYAPWEFMGTCRMKAHPHRLWHDSESPADYAAQARKLGLPYGPEDFADPNMGEGEGDPGPEEPLSGQALPRLLADLGDDLVGAEIGLWRGATSRFVLRWCGQIRRWYGIDPYVGYLDWHGPIAPARLEGLRAEVQQTLGADSRFVFLCEPSDLALPRLEPLDVVFIDGDHAYEQVGRDLRHSWERLKPGGLLCGHDYRALATVHQAVTEFAAELGVKVREAENDVWWWRKDLSAGFPSAPLVF